MLLDKVITIWNTPNFNFLELQVTITSIGKESSLISIIKAKIFSTIDILNTWESICLVDNIPWFRSVTSLNHIIDDFQIFISKSGHKTEWNLLMWLNIPNTNPLLNLNLIQQSTSNVFIGKLCFDNIFSNFKFHSNRLS